MLPDAPQVTGTCRNQGQIHQVHRDTASDPLGESSRVRPASLPPPPSPSSSHGPWPQHPAKLPPTAPLYLTSRPSGSVAVTLPTFVPLATASLTVASNTCWKNCGASFTSVTTSLKVAEELALYCTPGTRGSGFSAWTTILWMGTVSKSRGCTGGKKKVNQLGDNYLP